MALFGRRNEEKDYKELIRIIRNSRLNAHDQVNLVNYVSSIAAGTRNNDFFDFEFLHDVILLLCNSTNKYENIEDIFKDIINSVKLVFPQGTKTENYDSLKGEFIVNFCGNDGIIAKRVFNNEFFSIFSNRNDYLQVMSIILSDDNLIDNFDSIVNFAVEISKEIEDPDLIKREIISYIHAYGSILSSDEDYLQKRVDEARKRYGVYPGIDEKTVATISRNVEKAKSLIKRFEVMEKKVSGYEERINSKMNEGLKIINDSVLSGKKELEDFSSSSIIKMQNDLEEAKKSLTEELKRFLISLEDSMKNNSDQIFNQLLIDAKEKIEELSTIAESLSGTTTKELLKIQQETRSSVEKLRNYVQNSPELKSSLQIATDSEEVMKALLDFNRRQEELRKASEEGVAQTSPLIIPERKILVSTEGVGLDDTQRDFLVPKFTMVDKPLEAFDRKVKFKDRMKKIEESIARLEGEGYIIPPALKEALPWYVMGNKVVYFYGPTQSGKTTVCDLLAKVVGSELIDGGKITEEHSVTSYNDVNGRFDESPLFYSLYYGLSILYDEFDNGNADNIVVLGTFASKLAEKIRNPEKDVMAQFAKRRFVPINENARIITAGNTSGKGRNRQYGARSRFDESSQERLVPIYVDYSDEVERKIFGNNTGWYKFFEFFRLQCNDWAKDSGLDAAEGNVTTGDAATIVDCIKEDTMTVSQLINGIFIQTKEPDYISHLKNNIKSKYSIESIQEDKISKYNNTQLKNLSEKQIAEAFVFEAEKALNKGRALAKRR